MLHLSGNTPDGSRIDTRWKAFLSSVENAPPPPPMKWEFKWFIGDLGYGETKSQPQWVRISENWGRWQAHLQLSGFCDAEHMGRSRHALLAQKSFPSDQDLERAEQGWPSCASWRIGLRPGGTAASGFK